MLLPAPQGEGATEGWPQSGDTELRPVGPCKGWQGRRTPTSIGAANSGLRAPQAGGNLSPTARVTPGNGLCIPACESTSSLGMLLPTQEHRGSKSRSMAWPRLYEELKAAGEPRGVKEQPWHPAPCTGPLQGSTLVWDFSHHNHRKVELKVPPHPPKTKEARKRGHTREASAQPVPRPIKAKIKGLQEQL